MPYVSDSLIQKVVNEVERLRKSNEATEKKLNAYKSVVIEGKGRITFSGGILAVNANTDILSLLKAIEIINEALKTDYLKLDQTIQQSVTGDSPVFNLGITSPKLKITPEGGIAVLLTNRSGVSSVKGYLVRTSDTYNNAVRLSAQDIPDPIGVFYESGIADGSEAWIVISGIADVYFTGSVTRGDYARGFVTSDGGDFVAGQSTSEAIPTSPFATDEHFYEIGHVLEARTGAGLAKVALHFN